MTREQKRIQLSDLRAQLQECEAAQRQAFLQGDVARYQKLSAEVYSLESRISKLQLEPVTQ